MAAEQRDPSVTRASVSVLVADDMPDIRLLLKATLQLEDRFEVVGEACDGEQCLVLADQLQPEAVVLDLGMPRADGLETVTRLRDQNPDARIVVLSGQQTDQIADEARARGADAYLQKGSAVDRLVETLRSLFN